MSAAADGPGPERLPGVAPEDTGRLATVEADVAYRWAAGAVRGREVLVVGCRHPHGAETLRRAGAGSVLAADPDARLVEVASRLYPDEGIGFVTAGPGDEPIVGRSFGAVVSVEAAGRNSDLESPLDELVARLEPGGVLLIGAPIDPTGRGVIDELESRFEHVASWRRRLAIAAAVAPATGDETPIGDARWLAADEGEDRTLLLAASDAALPDLGAVATMAGIRELRAWEEALEAWEGRARMAEAEGSAKHWELVAAREAQRRLRMRLHRLEHRPLRILSRVLRGKPARLGEGPPLRVSEADLKRWD